MEGLTRFATFIFLIFVKLLIKNNNENENKELRLFFPADKKNDKKNYEKWIFIQLKSLINQNDVSFYKGIFPAKKLEWTKDFFCL